MRVNWQVFKEDGQIVEAQVFQSDTGPSRRLVLFCPGFPGLGASMFEQRHAAELVNQRYDVIVIKHAGTRIDCPLAPVAINNATRLNQAYRNKETHLGGGPSTIAAWLKEPAIALRALNAAYDEISLIGNSFGAISSLWSLTMGGADTQRIRTILLYAGAQGIDTDPMSGIMRIWQPVYLTLPLFWEIITLDSPQSIHDTLKIAYADINRLAPSLAPHISIQYLVVAKDEILRLSDTEAFNSLIGGRGKITIDDIDQPHPTYNMRAHDTPDYPTEKLLELLQ